jgi:hypothetical protein
MVYIVNFIYISYILNVIFCFCFCFYLLLHEVNVFTPKTVPDNHHE